VTLGCILTLYISKRGGVLVGVDLRDAVALNTHGLQREDHHVHIQQREPVAVEDGGPKFPRGGGDQRYSAGRIWE